jgi:hypothetical protein
MINLFKIFSPLNNIDANFDKISDLVKKYFDEQKNTFIEKQNGKDSNKVGDSKGVEYGKKNEILKIEEFKDLFNTPELEDLNNLFLNYSSDEVNKNKKNKLK